MTIRQHLRLIPTTLVFGLSLLATVPAQSNGEQEPNTAETITAQQRLQNRLDALLSIYTELDKQLPQVSSPAKAKRIWETLSDNMGADIPDFWDVEHDLEAVPPKEQKRFLAPYKNQLQPLRDKLNMHLDRLGIHRGWPNSTNAVRTDKSFFEAWENLVQQYPEESDTDEIFKKYLEQLNSDHKLLSSIQTPHDRQRIEEIINSRPKPDNTEQDNSWINKLQTMLQKLPPETQKRLYIEYLCQTQNLLPLDLKKASGQYHYLVYQSEPLLQYLSRRYEELYMLQKEMENLSEQAPANFPADLPEKEILIQQNYMLTKQLSGLLSTATGKAAAAVIGPRANDLKDRFLKNREQLISADDVSPEEQTRIDRQYGLLMRLAVHDLNRQVQRLASKNAYRNDFLSDIVEELSTELNPPQTGNPSTIIDYVEISYGEMKNRLEGTHDRQTADAAAEQLRDAKTTFSVLDLITLSSADKQR